MPDAMELPKKNVWNPETDKVSARLTGLLQEDSPLMQAAKTTGLKMANRRGLLNTSMAVGAAQGEMLKAAVPIASQESAQAAARGLSAQAAEQTGGLSAQEATQAGVLSAQEAEQTGVLQERQFGRDYEIQARDITAQMDRLVPQLAQREQEVLANIASNDREKATAGVRDMTQIYNEGFKAILANPDLDEAARGAYLTHIAELRETDLNLIEQLYGIDLTWASPEISV